MLYPFFVVFANENREEVASSLILANSKETAEAIAYDAAVEEEINCHFIIAVPFTLDFINKSVNQAGVAFLSHLEDNLEEYNGGNNYGFF